MGGWVGGWVLTSSRWGLMMFIASFQIGCCSIGWWRLAFSASCFWREVVGWVGG